MKVKVKLLLKRFPVVFFLRTVIVNRGNSCEWNREKKNLLFLRQWPHLYQFSKVSKRTYPLKLVKSGQFFFHANYRIPVCETTTKYFWYNWLPVLVNMSWELGLKWFWMKQFFTKAVLSLFCYNICKFPILLIIITFPC